MKNILVVGSINMDMVITVDRVPRLGETLSGDGCVFYDEGMVKHQSARKTHVVLFIAIGITEISVLNFLRLNSIKSHSDIILPH